MHLISFRAGGRDGLAVWCGCPLAAVQTWQRECDERATALGVPAPQVMMTARRPTTDHEVDALRAAGIVVYEFDGWDQVPLRPVVEPDADAQAEPFRAAPDEGTSA